MTPKAFASCAVVVSLLIARTAIAQTQYTGQPDSPQWLKDRRFNDGMGVRAGDLVLHPAIAGEVGYDSNWLLRSDRAGVVNGPAPLSPLFPPAPVVPALEFRVTPSLYLSTVSAEATMPSFAFRGGFNATYREFICLGSNCDANNDISQQRSLSAAADARLDIVPGRPVSGALFATFARVVQPNMTTTDPNLAFNRDNVGVGGDLAWQPNSGTLDWHVGYQLSATLFEDTTALGFSNLNHEISTRGRWRFRPRSALLSTTSIGFVSYTRSDQAAQQGLVDSTPVRSQLGYSGLVTDRFAVLALAGWATSFYSRTRVSQQPQYDSFTGQLELKWYFSAAPGAGALDIGTLSLSSITLGYNRAFQNSYLGNYYGIDRGYLRFNYFFAGALNVAVEGGLGSIEYPDMFWADGVPRHAGFTDLRADATLFSEYHFTSTFGLNATLRYTANFSQTHDLSDVELPANSPPNTPNPAVFDMEWRRFEAFLGARLFW
jgi:hypothetical protein